MRATTITVGPLATADADGIAQSQTPSSAFTLNGALVVAGVGVLDTPRRVLFTQAASESGNTNTIIGTSDGTAPQTEVVSAAASATTVQSALDFKTVTSVSISAAAAGAITVGTSGVASSRWMRLDEWIGESVGIQCTVTGTVNYTVQGTMQDPNSPTNPVNAYSVTWNSVDDTSLVTATATASGVISVLPIYIKVTLNSGTGSVSTVVSQATTGGGGGGSGGGAGGGVVQGAVTTASPTYTDGTNDDLSLDTHGGLRVLIDDSSGSPVDWSLPAAVYGTGTAGAPSSGTGTSTTGVITAQGPNVDDAAAGTTAPVPVGGIYNSSAPAYTNGDRTQIQMTASGGLIVAGFAADDAAASGNPVPVAGKYTASAPTFTDGDAAQLRLTASGNLIVGGSTADDAAAPATNYPVPVGGRYNATLPTYTDGDRTQAQYTMRGETIVGGAVAAAATDLGNPVKIGGVYNSTTPTYTTGQRGDVQIGTRGSLSVQLVAKDGTASPNIATAANDATSNSTGQVYVGAFGLTYNGSTWDRMRGIAGSFGAATGVLAVESAGASFGHYNTNASNNVKGTAGILHRVTINTKGATGNTLTLYNDTSGGTSNAIAVIDTTVGVDTLTYDLGFSNGLQAVLGTGTAADVTIVYR